LCVSFGWFQAKTKVTFCDLIQSFNGYCVAIERSNVSSSVDTVLYLVGCFFSPVQRRVDDHIAMRSQVAAGIHRQVLVFRFLFFYTVTVWHL